jgi:hypothetical protein
MLIPQPSVGEWMPVPSIGHELNAFMGRVNQSFGSIYKRLEQAPERPISSHRVLLALVDTWPTISEIYGWA